MINKIAILLVLLFGIAACSQKGQKEKEVEITKLTLNATLTELSDSSFIPTIVTCIDANENGLYFSDYAEGVIVLDKDLNVKKRIGSRGEGPGEFIGAAHFCLGKDDSIYVLNEGKQALELFIKGEHVKHIPFPQETSFTIITCFFFEHQLIYHSVVSDSLQVVVFDNSSNINKFICSNTSIDKPDFKRHSGRHLIKGDSSFFVIGCTLPIFQVYSFDGKLIAEHDLRTIPEIRKNAEAYKNTPQVPNTYSIMIRDACYNDGKVYLLVITNEDKYICNKVCVLDVSEKIEHINTLELTGSVYGSFCITKEGRIVAFNALEASLDFFTLPEYKENGM